MGVKDLWPILGPVREELTLFDLAGKRLAVDLSGWVCESCGAKVLASAVGKPYLRTLFFRVLTLYRLGASLVFVADGDAVRLKWTEMEKRERERHAAAKGRGAGAGGRWRERNTGTRTQLNNKISECCDLLDLLGLPHLQSEGEAEAFCALLNRVGIVDGVLTQDSDSFPYGATVVYKNLSTNGKEPQLGRVDCYRMANIEKVLGLTRSDLICLALLQGCDYCPQGVPGVGKETALKLVAVCKSCDASCDLVERVRKWRDGRLEEDQLSTLEKKTRSKALAVPGFPNEEVIQEYMVPKDTIPSDTTTLLNWKMPQVAGLQSFCSTHLGWSMEYSHGKAVCLLTQWLLRQENSPSSPIHPSSILHQRVRHRVACYEIQWEGDRTVGIMEDDSSADGDNPKVQFVTLENAHQFEASFPELCEEFRQHKELKQQKRKGRRKKTRKLLEEDTQVQELSDSVEALSIDVPQDHTDASGTATTKSKQATDSLLCQDSRSHKRGTELEQQENGSSLPVGIAIDLTEVVFASESIELSPGSNTTVVDERQPKSSPHKCKQNSGGLPSPVIDLDSYCTLSDSYSDPEDEMPLFARLKKNKVARQLWQPSSSNLCTETLGQQKPQLPTVATGGDVCILDSPPKKKKVSCSEFLEADSARGSMETPIVID